MKKIAFLAFIGAVVVGSIAAGMTGFGKIKINDAPFTFSNTVEGSGNVVTESRDVSEFSRVSVGGVFKAEIIAGKEFSVVVEADDNLLPLINTEVLGDKLEISTDSGLRSDRPIMVRITAPAITEVEATGAANVDVSGLQNEMLTLSLSGASKMNASGETGEIAADISGASSLNAFELTARSARVVTSGASRSRVSAADKLFADASGASTILYKGTPEITRSESGASTIRSEE